MKLVGTSVLLLVHMWTALPYMISDSSQSRLSIGSASPRRFGWIITPLGTITTNQCRFSIVNEEVVLVDIAVLGPNSCGFVRGS